MGSELQEKLEELKNTSAWTIDEALEILTGITSIQIEYLESSVHPPAYDIRFVKMRETRQTTWPAGKKTDGRQVIYKKNEIIPVGKKQAEKFISNGWAKDNESSAERKKRIKREKDQYQQAQDQSKLLKMIKRAIQDRDIESVNDVDKYPLEKLRLKRESILSWLETNSKKISPLCHFPSGTENIFKGMPRKTKPKSKRHEKSSEEKKAVRKEAEKLWKENKDLTIKDVIFSNEINTVAQNRHESTLRKWVKDLAPSNKPGRRPKKN